jgi:hypothetical protein
MGHEIEIAFVSLLALVVMLGTAQVAAAQGPCGDIYTVLPGNTLTSITRRCETTVQAILKANPQMVHPHRIFAG